MQYLSTLFFFIILIFSVIIHEYSHGWMADQLGDTTARLSGRLTMNPIPHIDPIGSILVPMTLFIVSRGTFFFAWAKPVPFNPYALKNPEKDAAKIALAGPVSNLAVALFFGALVRIMPVSELSYFFSVIVYINILLAVFNLVPIPPLDGSKILFAALPCSLNDFKVFLNKYGFFILLFFIVWCFDIIIPIIKFLFRAMTGNMPPF